MAPLTPYPTLVTRSTPAALPAADWFSRRLARYSDSVRTFNRLLSLLLGAALVAGGVLALTETAAAVFGQGPLVVPAARWADEVRQQTFSEAVVVTVFAAVAVVGLVLLIAEVSPWPKRRVAWAKDAPGAWWLLRRSVEQHVARSVIRNTSATGAHVIFRPRRRRWSVEVQADAAPAARPAIAEQARQALAALAGDRPVSVDVFLRRPRRAD